MPGTKTLRITGLIEIIMGAASLAVTRLLLSTGHATIPLLSEETIVKSLFLAYGMAAFQIVAGLIGVIFAHKKSNLTFVCGVLLFIPQCTHFFNLKGMSVAGIVINAVLLLVPYLYLMAANKNLRNA